jgi:hypothetical protein
MTEKHYNAVLVLDWNSKSGSMCLVKRVPNKLKVTEICVNVNLSLEIPDRKPIEATLDGKIVIPEHQIKKMVVERLEGKDDNTPL